jgi:hypothetical protein
MAAEVIRRSGTFEVDVDRFKAQVAKWPAETTIQPLKWRKAELAIAPGKMILRLKASTLPKHREISIPATAGLMKSLITAVGEIKVDRPGEVFLKTSDSEVSLWKETPLVAESREVHKR